MAKAEVEVIGCGNLLAYDEGVGVHVVRRLQKEVLPDKVIIRELRTPGQVSTDLLSGAKKVVIVDACKKESSLGSIYRYAIKGAEEKNIGDFLSHTIHGYNILPIFEFRHKQDPDKFPQDIVIIAIEISERNKFAVGLSPSVHQKMETIIQKVMEELY